MVCLCVCAKIRRPHSLSHYFHWQHPLVWSSLVTERLTKATAVFINLSSGFARRRRSSNCSSGRFLSAHSNLFHLSVLHQSRPNLPRDIMLRIESPKSIDFMSPWRRLRGRGGEATGTCRFPHGHRKVNFWHPDVPPEMFGAWAELRMSWSGWRILMILEVTLEEACLTSVSSRSRGCPSVTQPSTPLWSMSICVYI